MPNISVDLPDIETSITRPVVLDVVRQLKEITGIAKDARVLFPGDEEESYQPGSTMAEQNNDERVRRTTVPFGDQMEIEMVEEPALESMLLSTAKKDEHIPVYLDEGVMALVRPIKTTTKITLNIRYRAASKTAATAWKNRIEAKLMNYGEMNLHTATYNYQLPEYVVDLLREIHSLRENVAGYGETFAEYLDRFTAKSITVIANQSGAARSLAIAETQNRIIGLYDFEVAPDKGDKDANGGASWTTTFSYTFQYDKPIQCNMVYPVMVHNQLLADRFQIPDNAPNPENQRKSFSNSGAVNYYFEAQNQIGRYKELNRAVTLPSFDEFRPDNVPRSTETLFTALCMVDEDESHLVSLDDLGDFELDADVLEYLRESEWKWITKPYACPFHVSLFKNNCLIDDTAIKCTDKLEIRSYEELNKRHYHQIRFAIVSDIDSVNIDALKRLKRYPKALPKVLMTMGVTMADLKLLAQRVDFTKEMKNYLPDTGPSMHFIHQNRRQWNTVQLQYVAAYKAQQK